MSSEQVRILVRLQPEIEFYTVSAIEVPADHVPIHLTDCGAFYASPELIRTLAERAGYAHPEFPPEIREHFRRFERVFDQVYSRTVEQWEHGFRKDAHPWAEIALWDWWADTVERFTAHLAGSDSMTQENRKEVAAFVLSLGRTSAEDRDAILKGRAKVPGSRILRSSRIHETATWMFSDERAKETNTRREQYRKLIQGKELPGPDRVTIDALFDVPGTGQNLKADLNPDKINAADIIFGVSRKDGHKFLLYGKEVMERIVRTGNAERVKILSITMDQETGDLERAVAFVTALKGRHDYQGG